MACILVCEDEPVALRSLKNILEREGYTVYIARNGFEALEILQTKHIDLVITDIKMPVMDGFKLLTKVREVYPWIKVIMITGYYCIEEAVKAIKMGASDYLTKPLKIQDLKSSVRAVLDEARRERERRVDFKLKGISQEEFECLLRALNNPLRREIILALTSGRLSFSELKNRLNIDSGTLNHHLRNLKAFGILERVQDGYSLTGLGKKAAGLLSLTQSS